MLSAIALVFCMPLSYTNAGPQDPNFGYYCTNHPEDLAITCCWKETDEEGISIDYCQICEVDTDTGDIGDCGEKYPNRINPPTTDEKVNPENDKVIDEQQPNSKSPLTDQRAPLGNVGGLEQLEDLSNNENSESGDSVSSDNPGLFNVVPQNPTVSQQQTTDDSNNEDSNNEDSNNENLPQGSEYQR